MTWMFELSDRRVFFDPEVRSLQGDWNRLHADLSA
jgi:hypothetical protein